MGINSNKIPPLINEEIIDREKKKKKDLDLIFHPKNLQLNIEELKERVKN